MYNYSFAPLQRSYSRNIPGRTRDFQIPAYVRYSSEGPTTPGGPLRPDRRRPWGPTDHSSSRHLCRPVFVCLHLLTRRPTRRAISAPQLQAALFDLIDEDCGGPRITPRHDASVARSPPVFVFRPEDPRDGPSPRLLLTSASLLLMSCLRSPSATGPKVVSPTTSSILFH